MKRLLAVTLLLACGGPRLVAAPDGTEHLAGDAWFAWRAQRLGISVEQARARDAAIAEDAPPVEPPDAEVRTRAAATWKAICATCHGLEGDPPERPGQPTPRAWDGMGAAMGFTFGGDKMRAGVYRKIRDGVGEAMPAWGQALSREQIWALVVHIESF